jgi:hypothetical protein
MVPLYAPPVGELEVHPEAEITTNKLTVMAIGSPGHAGSLAMRHETFCSRTTVGVAWGVSCN